MELGFRAMDWADLLEVKRARGLSWEYLARHSGYSASHIRKVLYDGDRCGSRQMWIALAGLLDVTAPPPPNAQENGRGPYVKCDGPIFAIASFLKCAKKWHFKRGGQYVINKANLVFLRKEGIHHIFKHKSVGWRIAYTDSQLVDAEVKPK